MEYLIIGQALKYGVFIIYIYRTKFEASQNVSLGIHSDGVEAGALSKDGRQLGKKFKHDKNQNRNCWDW